jgi:hypothetical protein
MRRLDNQNPTVYGGSIKPIMLLDVDGVLNVLDPIFESRKARTVRLGIRRLPFWPAPHARTFLLWAFRNFEVYWLTCWFAWTKSIENWADVPHRPFLGMPRLYRQEDWKLTVARSTVGPYRTRPVVWVEDGFQPETRLWAKKHRNVLLVKTDSRIGITKAHQLYIMERVELGKLS